MNTRTLSQFLKVVELGSVSKAAVVLGINQPALSRAIRELEADLGVVLLYRDGRGVRPTEEGHRFWRWATTLTAQIDEMRADLTGDPDRNKVRHLTVGMLPSVARFFAIQLSESLLQTYPQAELRLIEGATGHLVEWLADQRIDIALLYDTSAVRRFNPEALIGHPMHLVCSAANGPLPAEVPFKQLKDLPLILSSRQIGNRREFEAIAARQKIALRVLIEADSLSSLVQLVDEGLGYSILPIYAVHKEVLAGTLVASPITEPSIDRTLVIAGQNNRAQLAGFSELITDLKHKARSAMQVTGWSNGREERR